MYHLLQLSRSCAKQLDLDLDPVKGNLALDHQNPVNNQYVMLHIIVNIHLNSRCHDHACPCLMVNMIINLDYQFQQSTTKPNHHIHKALTWSSANLSSAAVGSEPGDNTKIRGAQELESPNALARSNGGGSTYFLPSFSVTKSCTQGVI